MANKFDAVQAALEEAAKLPNNTKPLQDQIDALSTQIQDLVQQRATLKKQLDDATPDDTKRARQVLDLLNSKDPRVPFRGFR